VVDAECSGLSVDPATAELSVATGGGAAAGWDFETKPTITCGIVATDSTSRTDEATVTVTLVDANDAPRFGNGALSVLESATAGALVGSLQMSDQDTKPGWGSPSARLARP